LTPCAIFQAQKNPHKAGSFKCPCLLFASRYSFAKLTGIEAVYVQKCKNFFKAASTFPPVYLCEQQTNHWLSPVPAMTQGK
ncbi:hypothetical protein ACT9DF_004227, partial [Shigella flexneri]